MKRNESYFPFYTLFAVIVSILIAGCTPLPTDQNPAILAALGRSIAAGASTASIMPALENRANLYWAVWDDTGNDYQTVHIALIDKSQDPTTVLSSLSYEDSYNPTLQILPNWRFNDQPVICLRYQAGGSVSEASFFGIDAHNQIVPLSHIKGALIELFQMDGDAIIRVYTNADLDGDPSYLRWDPLNYRLLPYALKSDDVGFHQR